jgi:hypothetical protein
MLVAIGRGVIATLVRGVRFWRARRHDAHDDAVTR